MSGMDGIYRHPVLFEMATTKLLWSNKNEGFSTSQTSHQMVYQGVIYSSFLTIIN